MHKQLLAFVLVSVFAQSTTCSALGATGGSGRAGKEKAAKKACITRDVKTGIDILADLYLDTGDTTYVFNQARCYQQNRVWDAASDRFREFLRKAPDLTVKEKAEVNAHIAECDAMLAKQAGGVLLAPQDPSPRAVPTPAPTVTGTNLSNTGSKNATRRASPSACVSLPEIRSGGSIAGVGDRDGGRGRDEAGRWTVA